MMKLDTRKKRIIFLSGGILFIAALVVTIILLSGKDKLSDADFDPATIEKIQIKAEGLGELYSTNQFLIQERENIIKVIDSVKQMVESELKTNIKGLKSIKYVFTYYFKNGKVKTYSHDYLAVTSTEGFENVLTFDEVLKQITYVFTTKYDDIVKVKLFAWENKKAANPLIHYFTEKEEIEYIIKAGQDNLLNDQEKYYTITPVGVEFYISKSIEPVFIVYISPDMVGYDELCDKVPKIREFAEKVSN